MPVGLRLDALEACLGKLPTGWRELVDASYRRGEAVQDIAARQGRAAGVVSVTLFRIRKTLLDCVRSRLADEEGT